MPIKIPGDLPAFQILENENIFVMDQDRATTQDIRPLKIAIMNLMPTKIVTETQLLRLVGNTPIQVDVTLLQSDTHDCKNTDQAHLDTFYKTFSDVRYEYFDGLIITGAPIETLPFEEVDYWDELVDIMDWSLTHVYSTLHICPSTTWTTSSSAFSNTILKKNTFRFSAALMIFFTCPTPVIPRYGARISKRYQSSP